MSDSLVLPIAGSLPVYSGRVEGGREGLFFHWNLEGMARTAENRKGNNPKMAEDDLELRDVAGQASIF